MKKLFLLLIFSSCAVPLHDMTFCSPIPGGYGAACDNMLTSKRVLLTSKQWDDLQLSWFRAGNAVECTTSHSLGDIKKEIEKLCSTYPCKYLPAR